MSNTNQQPTETASQQPIEPANQQPIEPASQQHHRTACLTLDLESDWFVDDSAQSYLTVEFIPEYIELIQRLDVPVSVFVVGRFLEERPDVVEALRAALDVEFHLHSYSHDPSMPQGFEADLRRGIDAFEDFFGHRPRGYRAPLGKITDQQLVSLDQAGFEFDSSIFPSYRPGTYNNLTAPTEPYHPDSTDRLVELPIGVIPYLRIPAAQSYLKLAGRPYLRLLEMASLPDPFVFVTHLHDFFETRAVEHRSQPMRAIQKRNLEQSTKLFESAIRTLQQSGYRFRPISDIYDSAGRL